MVTISGAGGEESLAGSSRAASGAEEVSSEGGSAVLRLSDSPQSLTWSPFLEVQSQNHRVGKQGS